MTPYELFIEPFAAFSFMRRALVACLAIAAGAPAIGLFLILRRMALTGDAMSHAILPGAAVGFLVSGLSLPAMSIGGFVAGLTVASLAGLASRYTQLREDTHLAAFYLISLAVGVLIVSTHGSNVDLIHVLFGTVLAIDDQALYLLAGIASVTVLTLAVIVRPLTVECFDPGFLRNVSGGGPFYHMVFLLLVVLNLVAGFQALGSLMAVGLMILPPATARFWTRGLGGLLLGGLLFAILAGVTGLLLSYHANLPSGPAIILTAGVWYIISLGVGRYGSVRAHLQRLRHLRG